MSDIHIENPSPKVKLIRFPRGAFTKAERAYITGFIVATNGWDEAELSAGLNDDGTVGVGYSSPHTGYLGSFALPRGALA